MQTEGLFLGEEARNQLSQFFTSQIQREVVDYAFRFAIENNARYLIEPAGSALWGAY